MSRENTTNYNINDLKRQIDILDELQYHEIFKIILKNNEKYTTNTNGIFINLSNLKQTTIQEIINYLNYCNHTINF
jgi:proline dehydrogenase